MANFWKSLPKPFTVLAPMEGVTDHVFREIVSEVAPPDVFFTEFTNTEGLFSDGRKDALRSFEYSQRQHPIVAQIWGTIPDNFYKAAQLIKKLGFDGIDINMGCPVRDVVKMNCGAGLIKHPDLARAQIEAAKKGAGDLPVSVKTRIGFSKIATDEWISFLLEQNIDALIVHARTVAELSKVPTHWDEIGKAVRLRDEIAPQTIIVGNGDIKDHSEAIEAAQKYKVDGVMIGRGIFHNPWAFEKRIQNHSIHERLNILLKHTKLFEEKWGKEKHFDRMKKYFKIYASDFNGASELRQQLMSCSNYRETKTALGSLMDLN